METLVTIARIHSDFPEKFGIPRQSNLVEGLRASVLFEPGYRDPEALRGLEGFSHIWLLWGFSQVKSWSPTVRPPRLGGNVRLGVFATRSPFRPNPIGLSCVRLAGVEKDGPEGPVLRIEGGDLLDGSPIYDIKPYIPYADSFPDAAAGFAAGEPDRPLEVADEARLLEALPPEPRETLRQLLACDPRPPYQNDPGRVYGMAYAGYEVKFRVEGETLTVVEISEGRR